MFPMLFVCCIATATHSGLFSLESRLLKCDTQRVAITTIVGPNNTLEQYITIQYCLSYLLLNKKSSLNLLSSTKKHCERSREQRIYLFARSYSVSSGQRCSSPSLAALMKEFNVFVFPSLLSANADGCLWGISWYLLTGSADAHHSSFTAQSFCTGYAISLIYLHSRAFVLHSSPHYVCTLSLSHTTE